MFAGYRGYGCTDGAVADSDTVQLAATLLLTLSNALFLPAIFLSLYRRFFPEALSFTYTMFFSTVSIFMSLYNIFMGPFFNELTAYPPTCCQKI